MRKTEHAGAGNMLFPAAALLGAALIFAAGAAAEGFVSDPEDPFFRELSAPAEINEADYGAGPLLRPGRTLHVKTESTGAGDGSSPEDAITLAGALRMAEPGDTVLIYEGVYYEDLPQIPGGEPGRPVRVFAAPGERVIICASRKTGPFLRTDGYEYVYETGVKKPENIELYTAVWEADSRRVLEVASSVEHVEELPGTFFFDPENDRLHVRFSDGRDGEGRHVYILNRFRGIRLDAESSHIHIRGIRFKHAPFYGLGVFGSSHTVEECVFFANWGCGLYMGASRSLIKNNYGFSNEDRGTIRLTGGGMEDNLIIGNRADPSLPSGRSGRATQRWAINTYGHAGRRSHIINNIMNDSRSFRYKWPVPGTIFQGNVCTGTVYCEGGTRKWDEDEDRIILRNNTVLGGINWGGDALGEGGWNRNWYGPDKASFNNFTPRTGGGGIRIEEAGFADPSYLDYRLQSDSPLKGAAADGGDRGAYPRADYRIYYAGPGGSDSNPGTSVRLAFETLGKAASVLKPGDTLYVLEGDYAAPLSVSASGGEESPVTVRSHGGRGANLPSIEVSGSRVVIEGFTVSGAEGHGIRVTGENVTLRDCVVSRAGSAAVYIDALDSVLEHCTLVLSREGVRLGPLAKNAVIRNSIIAHNREAQVYADEAAAASRSYNTCYFGEGSDPRLADKARGNILADPEFTDPENGDFRLRWTSPCVYLGEFFRPAGAMGSVPRELSITAAAADNVQSGQAVVSWKTPEDDSTGRVRYRAEGESRWSYTPRTPSGTRHAAALLELLPETSYLARVEAEGRFSGPAVSGTFTFKTPAVSRGPAKFYLSPDGDDGADGLSPGTAWRSIRKANMEVFPGDTVLIAPGVYRDPINPVSSGLPDRRITFRKHGEGEAIIDTGEVPMHKVELIRKNHVTIDGLSFDLRVPKGSPPAVIWIRGNDIEIINCRFRSFGPRRRRGGGIIADNSRDILIEDNIISDQRYALRAYGSRGFTLRNNTFTNSQIMHLVFSWGVTDIEITGNIFYQERGRGNPYILLRSLEEVEIDRNVYAPAPDMKIGNVQSRENGVVKLPVDGRTLEEWQALTGFDKNSIYADPMLMDPAGDDFRLKPGSPASGRGEDGTDIGARGTAGIR